MIYYVAENQFINNKNSLPSVLLLDKPSISFFKKLDVIQSFISIVFVTVYVFLHAACLHDFAFLKLIIVHVHTMYFIFTFEYIYKHIGLDKQNF